MGTRSSVFELELYIGVDPINQRQSDLEEMRG